MAALRDLNAAWPRGDGETLRGLLHPDIVMVQPGFQAELTGVDAAVASFLDFAGTAEVHSFSIGEITARCWAHTGVAWYRWEMSYSYEGSRLDEAGEDIWVFERDGERWRAVWRTVTPRPQ